jgi:hypothetical protein
MGVTAGSVGMTAGSVGTLLGVLRVDVVMPAAVGKLLLEAGHTVSAQK